jgi:hypothetical protein
MYAGAAGLSVVEIERRKRLAINAAPDGEWNIRAS